MRRVLLIPVLAASCATPELTRIDGVPEDPGHVPTLPGAPDHASPPPPGGMVPSPFPADGGVGAVEPVSPSAEVPATDSADDGNVTDDADETAASGETEDDTEDTADVDATEGSADLDPDVDTGETTTPEPGLPGADASADPGATGGAAGGISDAGISDAGVSDPDERGDAGDAGSDAEQDAEQDADQDGAQSADDEEGP